MIHWLNIFSYIFISNISRVVSLVESYAAGAGRLFISCQNKSKLLFKELSALVSSVPDIMY